MRYFAALLIAAPLLSGQQQNSSVEALMNQGTQAYRSNHYKEASVAFQKAIELDPSNLQAHLALAGACAIQWVPGSDAEESRAGLRCATREDQAALQIDPSNKRAILSLAQLAYLAASSGGNTTERVQKLDEAAALYRRLTEVDPDSQEGYYYLGVIAWSKSFPALSQARTQLGMNADDPGPLPNPGTRQALSSDYRVAIDEGIGDLEKVLIINPTNADAMTYLNLLLRERAALRDTREESESDITKAQQWTNQAIEIKRQQTASTTSNGSAEPGGFVDQPLHFLPVPRPSEVGAVPSIPSGIRVGGGVAEANLIRKVQPAYPTLAKSARVQGTVEFQATIGKEGRVESLQLVRGHPLLVNAAKEAVLQYVYRPTLLNGQPVEVVTDVVVNFSLAGSSEGGGEPQ